MTFAFDTTVSVGCQVDLFDCWLLSKEESRKLELEEV